MELRYDYLIIGGGIAGTTAAETIRGEDSTGKIAIVESEPHLLYSRVLLKNFIKGRVGEEQLMLRKLRDYERQRIDIYTGAAVDYADLEKKEIRLVSGEILPFKKLLIASGGRPKPWPLESYAAGQVFRLRTLDDAKRLKNFIVDRKKASVQRKSADGVSSAAGIGRVVLAGGGFNLLDMIDIFAEEGFETSVILRKNRFWEDRLDEVGSKFIHDIWLGRGIKIHFEDEVNTLAPTPAGLEVMTKKMEKIAADAVCISIGLKRNLEFLQGQLDTGEGIRVNKFLETSLPGVWAAGDVAERVDDPSGSPCLGGSWSEAFLHGKIAGTNMSLEESSALKMEFSGPVSYSLNHLGNFITFVGRTFASEADKDTLTVSRSRDIQGSYVRFFLKNNSLVGAVAINAQADLGAIVSLIRSKKDISAALPNLADASFNLARLMS